jgi:hypothetical protein
MIKVRNRSSDDMEMTLEQFGQHFPEEVRQTAGLRRFHEIQEHLAPLLPAVKHIRRSAGRKWYSKPKNRMARRPGRPVRLYSQGHTSGLTSYLTRE